MHRQDCTRLKPVQWHKGVWTGLLYRTLSGHVEDEQFTSPSRPGAATGVWTSNL